MKTEAADQETTLQRGELAKPQARERAPWIGAWTVLLVYAAFGIWFGLHYKALPYFDQAQYVGRVYAIGDNLQSQGILAPSTWLGGTSLLLPPEGSGNVPPVHTWVRYDYAMRPPLLLAPAALLFGNAATPRQLGMLWLAMRLGALMAALWAIARWDGTGRWVPAALLVILGSSFWLNLEPSIYMMDQPFVAFGLLCFAALLPELRRPSIRGAIWLCAAVIALVLIKPAAPAFVFPMLVVLGVRGGVWMYQGRSEAHHARRIAAWIGIYALLGAALLYLMVFSPYGVAVHAQYELGSTGWYNLRKLLTHEQWRDLLVQMFSLSLPLWLAIITAAAVLFGKSKGLNPWAACAGAAVVVWWFAFSTILTYTPDTRFPASAFAIATVLSLMALGRSRWLVSGVTVVAAVFFLMNFGFATVWDKPANQKVWELAAGGLATRAHPVKEVGVLPAISRMIATIRTIEPAPEPVLVYVATRNAYTESDTFCLAARYAEGNSHWSSIRFLTIPYGSSAPELPRLLRQRWFVSRSVAPCSQMVGDVWTLHLAVHHLLLDPESPLRPLLEKSSESPLHLPTGADTLTLWHLRRPLSPEELAAAVRFAAPLFASTSGEAGLREVFRENPGTPASRPMTSP